MNGPPSPGGPERAVTLPRRKGPTRRHRQTSPRYEAERGLPFELAILMFERPTLEVVDARRAYGEIRIRAIGIVGNRMLACGYTDRGDIRRIISLRYASRKERDAYREAFAD